MGFWETRIFGKYLAGLMSIWNCDRETAMRTLCEAYYFLRGMTPEAASQMMRLCSKTHLEYVFQSILMEAHPGELDILERHSDELDQTFDNV